MLRENNYTITGLGDAYFFGLENAVENKSRGAKTIDGETLEKLAWNNTAFYPFVSHNYSESAQHILDSVVSVLDLKYISNSSQFTLLYLKPSHTPFTFDRNGNMLRSGFTNWEDKQYYLDAYIYTTKIINEIVESILKSDPTCIIILQSDHSARASSDSNLFMKMFELEDMSNSFNAVYYCGEQIDIEGLSCVNTWRLIANKLFNKNFKKVEVPIDEYKYK